MFGSARHIRSPGALPPRSALHSSAVRSTFTALALVAGACGGTGGGKTATATTALLSSTPPPAAASHPAVTASTGTTASPTVASQVETHVSSEDDPGPHPTSFDPGPNDTSGGPRTVRGTLALDTATTCISIDSDAGRLDLRFTQGDYSLGNNGEPALVDAEGSPIAHAGDTLFVAGFDSGAPGDCGTRFDVESLVSVLPSG